MTNASFLFATRLQELKGELAALWRDALCSRWLAWLSPRVRIALLLSDGRQSLWQDDGTGLLQPAAAADGKNATAPPPVRAIELPESLVLRQQVNLPPVSAADGANAIALQVREMSPFVQDDLVYGYARWNKTKGAFADTFDIVLASRKQIDQYLQTQASRLTGLAQAPEIWALTAGAPPIVFQGFGERVRAGMIARGRWKAVGLCVLALLLVLSIAVTPVLQKRAQAIQASQAYDGLQKSIAALQQQRETLAATQDHLAAVAETLSGYTAVARALNVVTEVLPDDAVLIALRVDGKKITIQGRSSDGAGLLQTLSAHPLFHGVKGSGLSRAAGAKVDSFTIEFTASIPLLGAEEAAAKAGQAQESAQEASQAEPEKAP